MGVPIFTEGYIPISTVNIIILYEYIPIFTEGYSACQHKFPKIDFPITFEVLNLQDKEYYIWNLHKIIFVVIFFLV